MKRSGSNYEKFRRDLRNGYESKDREHICYIPEAHIQMKYFKIVLVQKKKIEEMKGSQHTRNGN